MSGNRRKHRQLWTGKQAQIWFAFLLALALHALVFQIPLHLPGKPVKGQESQLEIALQKPEAVRILPHEKPSPVPETLLEPEPIDPPPSRLEPVVKDTRPLPEENAIFVEPRKQFEPLERKSIEQMSDIERQRLTSSLLSQQFIREKPLTEQLFGKPLTSADPYRAEFHIPDRPGMISMLDKPMPELPFTYQEGLVHFAYDPGVKGDLQRFWDVITPEFGWRTRYGTEVRCVWVLILGGCAWK